MSGRQQDLVRKAYADTVTSEAGEGCCVSGINVPFTQNTMGYTREELEKAGVDMNNIKMLGCGNPVKLANLRAGETVLDLGSGEGMDCFIAGDKVGAEGQVIGVDMTAAMLQSVNSTCTTYIGLYTFRAFG